MLWNLENMCGNCGLMDGDHFDPTASEASLGVVETNVVAARKASGIHALWRHLLHSWHAYSKPVQTNQAWSGQAKSALDGATRRVYPTP